MVGAESAIVTAPPRPQGLPAHAQRRREAGRPLDRLFVLELEQGTADIREDAGRVLVKPTYYGGFENDFSPKCFCSI